MSRLALLFLAVKARPIDRLALLLGQWFGTGLSPIAPGTVGAAGALPLFWVLRAYPATLYWTVTGLVAIIGVWASERCAEALGDKDPGSVVIDEVSGVLIAMGMVQQASWPYLAAAWVLFRVFDIWKPWLIDSAQNISPPGVGIMADDWAAGLVAGAVALAAQQLLPF